MEPIVLKTLFGTLTFTDKGWSFDGPFWKIEGAAK